MGGQGGRLLRKQLLRNPRKAVVPFHRQSFDFTCGPACLIMAMRHFEPALASGRELEVDLWREANLVEAYASSRQGLALAAHRRGFSVRTQGNAETIELVDCLGLDPSLENRKVAVALHRDLKRRCRQAQIPDAVKPVSLSDVVEWLARAWIPIVLVDARLVGDVEVPHWVLVTGIDPHTVTFHDPLAHAGNTNAPRREFAKRLGFKGTSCAVVIEGQPQASRGEPPRIPGSSRAAPSNKLHLHSNAALSA
ncbi:MAG TPA: peptidase C39 family protein [Thermoplasmata archaeon]|nr:peptidase C39 family protein [Thermoplasmata archaeon]